MTGKVTAMGKDRLTEQLTELEAFVLVHGRLPRPREPLFTLLGNLRNAYRHGRMSDEVAAELDTIAAGWRPSMKRK